MVKNSKILVAGGSGFIGSNLINELIANGNKVISLSKTRNIKNSNQQNVSYVVHDMTKPININLFDNISDIDYIVNCSGYVDHRDFPKWWIKDFFNDHFESLYSLTCLAIDLKVKALIHIGSSDEYGEAKS